ncbi:MAG: SRPBCC family protein [Acidimicrobiia bacterium]
MTFTPHPVDPNLDLVLEREVDIAPELVWRAWTTPELLTQWFTPKPYETPHCEIDLRPGGIFRTVMRSPEGEEMDEAGCYLEVVPNERLVWTGALGPGYRPQPSELPFTAVIELQPSGSGGTRYRAIAIHQDPAGRASHEEMGFAEGWGAALDQLVALAKTL